MKTAAVSILAGLTLYPVLWAQTIAVKADPGPDESISETYMALDQDCRSLVNKRADPTRTIAACRKVADEADKFAPQSHFVTRRAAYVFYTTALIQGKQAQDAVVAGDKAVAVVLLGHDDGSVPALRIAREGRRKPWPVIWLAQIWI